MKLIRNDKLLVFINLVVFLIFTVYISNAQNVKAIVINEQSNTPIVGVNVYVKKIAIGTTTDDKGEFKLKYFSKISENDTLNFSCVGYESQRITFSELKVNKYIVKLSESVQRIKEVTVTYKQQQKLQVSYSKLASLQEGLKSFGSVLIDDKIWVIGGDMSWFHKQASLSWEDYSDKQYVYDIHTNKWATSSLDFSKRAYHNILNYNDKIYVIGGKTLSRNKRLERLNDKIEVYNIKQNTILVDNTNPHQAVNFASFVHNDNLIVVGGSTKIKVNGEKECSNKVHLFNLKTGYWYELDDMPIAKETKGILIHNMIYLIGGYNFKPLDEIETYNIETGEWNVEGHLFYNVARPAIAYNDSIIYIFEYGRIQTYNIITKQLNLYSIDLWLNSCELFCANNKLYILGGTINDETLIQPSSDLYSIDLNEFKRVVIYDTKVL
ncbi:MAG: carboxypeptidase-like regulatory domain-containing protein [Bacteroidales bacterium]